MKQWHCFAVRSDWEIVLPIVEREVRIHYVLAGVFPTPEPLVFDSWTSLPNLGEATHEAYSGSQDFLVLAADAEPIVRTIRTLDRQIRFAFDQMLNADSISFAPGGLWGRQTIISGCVASVSESAASRRLLTRFGAAIAKQFRKVEDFYVGPAALERLRAGWRLTQAAQMPPEYDLRLQ